MFTNHPRVARALPYAVAGIGVLSLAVVAIVSYHAGYSRGSGTLTEPPLSAALINTRSTGDLSVALSDPGASTDFGDFWKTWNLLDRNFAPTSTSTTSTSTTQSRVVGAIDGLVRSYNDPYTVFIPKENAVAFKEQVNGEFEGIGAGVTIVNGIATVTGTLDGSPAQKAGLKPGDRILSVNGEATANLDINAIISKIRGPKDTTVSLAIARGSSQKESVVAITRGTVAIPTTATRVIAAAKNVVAAAVEKASAAASSVTGSVKSTLGLEHTKEDAAKQQFFVLQLATFAKSSTDAFIKDLGRFAKSDTPYLIIDLRNNPGGYLDVAVDLASYFLPKGSLVVSEKTGAASVVTEHRSLGYGALDKISSSRRIVVLVNRNSASASEILAGALQDHHVALVVGETSFGKGSVQTLVDIGNVGSLKLTIARWFTPNGKNISHTGITPDVVVNVQDPKYASSTDPFIDAATEVLLDDTRW